MKPWAPAPDPDQRSWFYTHSNTHLLTMSMYMYYVFMDLNKYVSIAKTKDANCKNRQRLENPTSTCDRGRHEAVPVTAHQMDAATSTKVQSAVCRPHSHADRARGSLSPLLRHARWRTCGRPIADHWRPLEAPGGLLKDQRNSSISRKRTDRPTVHPCISPTLPSLQAQPTCCVFPCKKTALIATYNVSHSIEETY